MADSGALCFKSRSCLLLRKPHSGAGAGQECLELGGYPEWRVPWSFPVGGTQEGGYQPCHFPAALSVLKDYTKSQNEWTITGKDGHKVEGTGSE